MKNKLKLTTLLLLVATMLFLAVSCQKKIDTKSLWANATYTEDTTLGEGANTVTVVVSAGDRSVTLTVKTDSANLGEALYELEIINDPSFFNVCNGILADWDKDQAYWGFSQNGESLPYGVGDAKSVTSGEPIYEITYTK